MIRNIETDLEKIHALARQKEEENWEFRSFLKGFCPLSPEEIDRLVHKLNREVSLLIDCTKCGNCCRKMKPVLNHSDIERFAKGLNISVAQFKEQYLVKCNEKGKFWFKTESCPFLSNNRCSQYLLRPADCRSYPHLHKKDFVFRLINVIENYAICPIVFNVYERLKSKLWHRGKIDEAI